MKKIVAYAIVNNTPSEGIKLNSSRLPIYWLKSVALEEARKWGNVKVVEVEIKKLKRGFSL